MNICAMHVCLSNKNIKTIPSSKQDEIQQELSKIKGNPKRYKYKGTKVQVGNKNHRLVSFKLVLCSRLGRITYRGSNEPILGTHPLLILLYSFIECTKGYYSRSTIVITSSRYKRFMYLYQVYVGIVDICRWLQALA